MIVSSDTETLIRRWDLVVIEKWEAVCWIESIDGTCVFIIENGLYKKQYQSYINLTLKLSGQPNV